MDFGIAVGKRIVTTGDEAAMRARLRTERACGTGARLVCRDGGGPWRCAAPAAPRNPLSPAALAAAVPGAVRVHGRR